MQIKWLSDKSNLFCTVILFAWVLLLSSCARMGQPDGGWYDDTPPRIVSASPADKGVNVKSKKVSIFFDEFIKLDDATNKVVVSPPQLEMAEVKSAGKKIIVDLKDSLKANTTYTIDFSDAISDNNEGNPLGNYTYSFSTGEKIDTFEVSGNVLDASNLEPIKGILVGLYDDLSDTVFSSKPFVRVSRTDSRGHFVIKGVAPGTYRVYALQDADGNYLYNQKSEMIAFSHDTFVPSCKPDIRQDTIWQDTLRIDSIQRVPYIHYYPDNISLLAFKQVQTDRYLLKTDRTDAFKIGMYFSYGSDQLPELRGLNFDAKDAFLVEPSAKGDTIFYWLRDTALVNTDSLTIEAKYLFTDTTGLLVMKTDTIEALPKMSAAKRQRNAEKEYEKWFKEQEKAKKHNEPYDTVMPIKSLSPDIKISSSMTPDKNIDIIMPTPLVKCDTSAIHLYVKHDSLWYRAAFDFVAKSGLLRQYQLIAEWRPDVEYSLEIDSAAFVDIYGSVSKSIKQGLKVRSNDEFSSLAMSISGIVDTCHVVAQLLNGSDVVQKEVLCENGLAEFFYLTPGKYYLRAFVDSNNNGVWDTGDFSENRQAEAVYYYPKEIECKAKWDISYSWNVLSLPINRQKPMAITKQKPDKDKKLRNRNAERARNLGININSINK